MQLILLKLQVTSVNLSVTPLMLRVSRLHLHYGTGLLASYPATHRPTEHGVYVRLLRPTLFRES
ncbi:MAG TPA: hypothetical protein VNU46_05435 [Gemmatimonadaceae bacterium]|nr:hypothetical protein [Gemmatimonadaceae bacterium]